MIVRKMQHKFAMYCFNHKKDNMVSTTYKKCENELCINRAYYNYFEEKK